MVIWLYCHIKVIMMTQYNLAVLKAEIIKSIAHPTRLMMVEALAGGEMCVSELNEMFEVDHSTISKHLTIMKKAGVLSDRKEGLKVYYRLEVPMILNFIGSITSVVENRLRSQLDALEG